MCRFGKFYSHLCFVWLMCLTGNLGTVALLWEISGVDICIEQKFVVLLF